MRLRKGLENFSKKIKKNHCRLKNWFYVCTPQKRIRKLEVRRYVHRGFGRLEKFKIFSKKTLKSFVINKKGFIFAPAKRGNKFRETKKFINILKLTA